MKQQSSGVIYSGPSLIDGAPIVVVATYSDRNSKTGTMVQTYILRADQAPLDAIRAGDDESICGDCVHRPALGGSCYVDVSKSVTSVFSAWVRGSYHLLAPAAAADMVAGRMVRMGAYGDPAAIPASIWKRLLRRAAGRTGYTHQWRRAYAQGLRSMAMASVDTVPERDVARALGWRTFRVRTADQALGAREIVCPASDEGGKRRQCITCRACDGAERGSVQASVAIVVHGARASRFIPIAAV